MTIGIVEVAALAARAAGVVWVTITSGLSSTSSAASAERRSGRLSACRASMTKYQALLPAQLA